MEVLELVVEKSIGKDVLARHSKLKSALRKVDQRGSTRTDARSTEEEKQRITAIIELCFEYRRENDPEERQNILHTLDEIAANESIELPSQNIEQWDDELAARRSRLRQAPKEGRSASRKIPEEILLTKASRRFQDASGSR